MKFSRHASQRMAEFRLDYNQVIDIVKFYQADIRQAPGDECLVILHKFSTTVKINRPGGHLDTGEYLVAAVNPMTDNIITVMLQRKCQVERKSRTRALINPGLL